MYIGTVCYLAVNSMRGKMKKLFKVLLSPATSGYVFPAVVCMFRAHFLSMGLHKFCATSRFGDTMNTVSRMESHGEGSVDTPS